MLSDAIGGLLPSAVGVALSPIPIIAVILMLDTPKARSNGPAFALGWVFGLTCSQRDRAPRRPRCERPGQRVVHVGQLGHARTRSVVPRIGRQAVAKATEEGRRTRHAEVDGQRRRVHCPEVVGARCCPVRRQPEEPGAHAGRRRVDRPSRTQPLDRTRSRSQSSSYLVRSPSSVPCSSTSSRARPRPSHSTR